MTSRLRIYTKSGDQGKTSLGSGARALKHAPAICVYGGLDEASAQIGLAAHYVEDEGAREKLRRVQDDLRDLGGALFDLHSGRREKAEKAFAAARVQWLEREIDLMEEQGAPLSCFVRPGRTLEDAYLHVARTVVRRVERDLFLMAEETPLPPDIMAYINRLSDFLFSLSLYLSARDGA